MTDSIFYTLSISLMINNITVVDVLFEYKFIIEFFNTYL